MHPRLDADAQVTAESLACRGKGRQRPSCAHGVGDPVSAAALRLWAFSPGAPPPAAALPRAPPPLSSRKTPGDKGTALPARGLRLSGTALASRHRAGAVLDVLEAWRRAAARSNTPSLRIVSGPSVSVLICASGCQGGPGGRLHKRTFL